MSKFNEKVMAMVETELEKNPDVSVQELYDKAKKINRSIGRLSNRQFHAQYPLQVKRRKNRAAGKKASPKAKRATGAKRGRKPSTRGSAAPRSAPARSTSVVSAGALDREAIRDLFLKFASDLTAAQDSKELVGVLAQMNRYVDEVARIVA